MGNLVPKKEEETCQGEDEDSPNPDAGNSRYGGGAPPPPAPPQPQEKAPVSTPASTTAEEKNWEVELRAGTSDCANYDGYSPSSSLDDIMNSLQTSQYLSDENDNSTDSSGEELGEKEEKWEVELRAGKSDCDNYDGYRSSSSLDDIMRSFLRSQHLSDENDNSTDSSGRELGEKELLDALFLDFDEEYDVFKQKIILLSQKYEFFRRTARDGNCFYRGFIFNYLEHVLEIQDGSERTNEVNHLRRCVENTKKAYNSLGSPPKAEENLLDSCNDFQYVINLIESGLSASELYAVDWTDNIISRTLPFLRLLVTVELCTWKDFYYPFVTFEGYMSIHEFCQYQVIPDRMEANHCQITALVNALGVPLIVENLDTILNNGVVQLNLLAFYPRLDSQVSQMKAFELQSTETSSSTSSSKGDSGERTLEDLSPAERRRLVTLLYRPGHYDILYPK